MAVERPASTAEQGLSNWLLREVGYEDARPVEPADEVAVLMRDYIAAAKSMQAISERIDARGGPAMLRKVA